MTTTDTKKLRKAGLLAISAAEQGSIEEAHTAAIRCGELAARAGMSLSDLGTMLESSVERGATVGSTKVLVTTLLWDGMTDGYLAAEVQS